MMLNFPGGVILTGGVARDAEIKYVGTDSKPKTTFSVQYDYDAKTKEAKWAHCEAWWELANVAAGIRKGDKVLVTGRVRTHEYNGKTYKGIVCDWVGIAGGSTEDAGELPSLDSAAGFAVVEDQELPF